MSRTEQALAKNIREHGIARQIVEKPFETPVLRDILHYLQYGTHKVIADDTPISKALLRRLKNPGAVHAPAITGAATVNGTPILGRGAHMKGLENKAVEAAMFNRYAPDAMAETVRMHKLPQSVMGTKDPLRRLDQIQHWLKQRFPKGYIVKGVNDFQSAGQLLTERDKLSRLYKDFGNFKTGPLPGLKNMDLRTLNRLKDTDPSRYATEVRKVQGLLGRSHVESMLNNPRSIIVQERLPLERLGLLDRLANKTIGRNTNTKEIRVHTLGSRVLPISGHRYGPLSQTLGALGHKPNEIELANQAVEQYLRLLPQKFVKNRSFSIDVGLTPKGPKIIETNPSSYSGFLNPMAGRLDPRQAITSHRFISGLQGQNTLPIAATHAALAGTAGIGGALAANAAIDRSKSWLQSRTDSSRTHTSS